MKISVQQLKRIISEELTIAEQEQDANKEIDKAQVEAEKIASRLKSELERVAQASGLDVKTLASLVNQFIVKDLK